VEKDSCTRFSAKRPHSRKEQREVKAGFGLLETAISLAVVGIMTVAVVKGGHLLEMARLNAVLAQVDQIRLAVQMFQDRNGGLPKDGVVETLEDSKAFYKILNETGASLPSNEGFVQGKMGGSLFISSKVPDHPGLWIVLANSFDEAKGVLTPAQAEILNKKGDNGDPLSGEIQAVDDKNQSGKCINGGKFNTDKDKACVVLFKLS
jgi:type II secretory pathway pseudopilin PulG